MQQAYKWTLNEPDCLGLGFKPHVTGNLSIKEIIDTLNISRATLYRYLRHRNIDIGTVSKIIPVQKQRTLKVRVHLIVENNNKFVRGKSRSRKDIENSIFSNYNKPNPQDYEYELTIPYENEKDLENTMK